MVYHGPGQKIVVV